MAQSLTPAVSVRPASPASSRRARSRPLHSAHAAAAVDTGSPYRDSPEKEQLEVPVRLMTRMSLPWGKPTTARYRAMAELLGGHYRLVCFGSEISAVRSHARRLGRDRELPPHTVAVVVQQWVGKRDCGHWRNVEE